MKQYKHKTVNATAELCSDGYWYLIKYFDKDGDETIRFSIPKYLIENTNDWEEITEAEPKNAKEEVIEGDIGTIDKYINSLLDNNTYESIKLISARLTVYPKPRKEYVKYVSENGIKSIKQQLRLYTENFLYNEPTEGFKYKIKITVEDE